MYCLVGPSLAITDCLIEPDLFFGDLYLYIQIYSLSFAAMSVCSSKFHQCLYFASQALARKVEKLAVACWQPTGLSPSHAYLLMLVLESPGIQPTELCAQLQLSPSTITRLAEKLEGKGLLVRRMEGKSTHIHPTPQAVALQPQMRQCMGAFMQQYEALRTQAPGHSLVQDMCLFADRLP